MSTYKTREMISMWVIALLMVFMSSCAAYTPGTGTPPIYPGDAIPVSQAVTNQMVETAKTGAQPLAKVLTNGRDVIVACPGPGCAWTCVVFQLGCNVPPTPGQTMNPQDMSDLMRWMMTALGWVKISSSELVPAFAPVIIFPTPTPGPQS